MRFGPWRSVEEKASRPELTALSSSRKYAIHVSAASRPRLGRQHSILIVKASYWRRHTYDAVHLKLDT